MCCRPSWRGRWASPPTAVVKPCHAAKEVNDLSSSVGGSMVRTLAPSRDLAFHDQEEGGSLNREGLQTGACARAVVPSSTDAYGPEVTTLISPSALRKHWPPECQFQGRKGIRISLLRRILVIRHQLGQLFNDLPSKRPQEINPRIENTEMFGTGELDELDSLCGVEEDLEGMVLVRVDLAAVQRFPEDGRHFGEGSPDLTGGHTELDGGYAFEGMEFIDGGGHGRSVEGRGANLPQPPKGIGRR